MRCGVSMAVALALGGCARVGEGVTRALLEAGRAEPAEDTRRCEITGAAFPPHYESDTRVIGLMVAGLGQPTWPAVTARCMWIEVDEALR